MQYILQRERERKRVQRSLNENSNHQGNLEFNKCIILDFVHCVIYTLSMFGLKSSKAWFDCCFNEFLVFGRK